MCQQPPPGRMTVVDARALADAVARLPHANATFVPYHLGVSVPAAEQV